MINDTLAQDKLYVEIPFMHALKTYGVDCDISYLGEVLKNTGFPLRYANNIVPDNKDFGHNNK